MTIITIIIMRKNDVVERIITKDLKYLNFHLRFVVL